MGNTTVQKKLRKTKLQTRQETGSEKTKEEQDGTVESRKTDEKRCRDTKENQTDNWTKKAHRTESKGRRETADRTGDKQRNDLEKIFN